jgi:hypothetical protein
METDIIKKILNYRGKPKYNLVKSHPLDFEKVSEWLSTYSDPDIQKCAEYLIGNSIHISWKTFYDELISINKHIIQTFQEPFQILSSVNPKKSVAYFSTLVYHDLQLNKNKKCLGLDDTIISNNILYIDDMSFSGSQLEQALKFLIELQNENIFLNDTKNNSNDIPIFIQKYPLIIRDIFEEENTGYIFYIEHRSLAKYIQIFYHDNKNQFHSLDIYDFVSLKEIIIKNPYIKWLDTKLKRIEPYLRHPKINYLSRDNLISINPIQFYLGIPFMSKLAVRRFEEWNFKYKGVKVMNLENVTMFPNIYDLYTICPFKRDFEIFMYFHSAHLYPIEFLKDEFDTIQSFGGYKNLMSGQRGVFDICPVWFDHKLSSPVSTISIILGCGLSVPYNKSTNKIIGKVKILGNLLQNCNTATRDYQNIQSLVDKFYVQKGKKSKYEQCETTYDPDSDEGICIYCPLPFYKFFNA